MSNINVPIDASTMSLDEKAKATEISPIPSNSSSTNQAQAARETPTPAPNTNTLESSYNTPSLTALENLQVLPKILREGILFVASGPALLLQAAHPSLSSSKSNSNLSKDLPATLHATLSYIAALVFGTREEKAALLGRLRLGQPPLLIPTSATAPEAQLWLLATIYITSTDFYQRIYGKLDYRTAEASYAEFSIVLRHLAPTLLPAGSWPSNRSKFWAYFDDEVERLVVSSAAQDFACSLPQRDDLSRGMSLSKPVLRAITVEMLPVKTRQGYGLNSTVGSRTAYTMALGFLKPCYPCVPRSWRDGHVEYYLREVRRVINT
ncbi:oxygenase MpaB family protein [Aspergillus undulatus]|uniref:oxygenase MpaB family protein n=1 Tax=Aspergillus undulatus TaxID=1810928 RepID=UPI003CCE1CC1